MNFKKINRVTYDLDKLTYTDYKSIKQGATEKEFEELTGRKPDKPKKATSEK